MLVLSYDADAQQRLPLIKTYSFLAFVGACIALAMQVLTIVAHFVLKQPQINQCIGNNQDINNPGSLTNNAFVQQDVSDACNSDWNRQTFYSIAWLIVALIWAVRYAPSPNSKRWS